MALDVTAQRRDDLLLQSRLRQSGQAAGQATRAQTARRGQDIRQSSRAAGIATAERGQDLAQQQFEAKQENQKNNQFMRSLALTIQDKSGIFSDSQKLAAVNDFVKFRNENFGTKNPEVTEQEFKANQGELKKASKLIGNSIDAFNKGELSEGQLAENLFEASQDASDAVALFRSTKGTGQEKQQREALAEGFGTLAGQPEVGPPTRRQSAVEQLAQAGATPSTLARLVEGQERQETQAERRDIAKQKIGIEKEKIGLRKQELAVQREIAKRKKGGKKKLLTNKSIAGFSDKLILDATDKEGAVNKPLLASKFIDLGESLDPEERRLLGAHLSSSQGIGPEISSILSNVFAEQQTGALAGGVPEDALPAIELPPGVSQEDFEETVRATGLTPEQVIQELNKRAQP